MARRLHSRLGQQLQLTPPSARSSVAAPRRCFSTSVPAAIHSSDDSETSSSWSKSTDPSLSRTLFVRPESGKHLLSPLHTLALVKFFASRFGPIQSFHFPREPVGQSLLGYGSITFRSPQAALEALKGGDAGEAAWSVRIPPMLPSRPRNTYIDDASHSRIAGPESSSSTGTSYDFASARWNAKRVRNPAALRPGWEDVAPLLGLKASSEPYYDVGPTTWSSLKDLESVWQAQDPAFEDPEPEEASLDDSSAYFIDPSPRTIVVKVERRVAAISARRRSMGTVDKDLGDGRHTLRGRPSPEALSAALVRFGGFNNGIREHVEAVARRQRTRRVTHLDQESDADGQETRRSEADPQNGRSHSTTAADPLRSSTPRQRKTASRSSSSRNGPPVETGAFLRNYSSSAANRQCTAADGGFAARSSPLAGVLALFLPGRPRPFSTTSRSQGLSDKARRKAEWQRNRKSNFVDALNVRVFAGRGGDGCVSFHREKYVQYGPPSGGNGGPGGSIYIRAVPGPTNLSRLSRRYRAQDGQHGQGSFLHGRRADDKIIEVPVGTVVTAVGRKMDEEEVMVQEYETDLLRRARKAGWTMGGPVAKEEAVELAEQAERARRLAQREQHALFNDPAYESNDHDRTDVDANGAVVEQDAEEPNEDDLIDGEALLDPEEAMHLQGLRDKVWRHFPRSEDSNYRRDEFRAAEMRLAFEKRRQLSRASKENLMAPGSVDRSAASQTPYEEEHEAEDEHAQHDEEGAEEAEEEATSHRVAWQVDLDTATPPSSPGILLASGGTGGLGNPSFLTSTNRSPKFATRGSIGESLEIRLEVKSPADIGLVGLPNAGKSTVLRALSGARAEVGSWQFTTLSPNLGVVRLDEHGKLVGVDSDEVEEGFGRRKGIDMEPPIVAASEDDSTETFRLTLSDVPGLIEGAAENRGLGHEFLRHVERCPVLVYVLDIGPENPHPERDLLTLRKELEEFRTGLSRRCKVVVANKADLWGGPEGGEVQVAKAKLARLRETVQQICDEDHGGSASKVGDATPMAVVAVSAKKRQGTDRLAQRLVQALREQRLLDEEPWGSDAPE